MTQVSFERRNPIIVLIFGFTGIYFLFWLFWTTRSLRRYHPSTPSEYTPFQVVGYLVGCVGMGAILLFLLPEASQGDITEIVGKILLFFSWVPIMIWFFVYLYLYCKIVETVTGRQVGAISTLMLFIFLTPIGMFLLQKQFNRAIDGDLELEMVSEQEVMDASVISDSTISHSSENETQKTDKKKDVESQVRSYIEENKNSYGRDALSDALKQSGLSDEDVEKYMKKYYDMD